MSLKTQRKVADILELKYLWKKLDFYQHVLSIMHRLILCDQNMYEAETSCDEAN